MLGQQETKQLHARKEGKREENRPKNRYKNILPCERQSLMITEVYECLQWICSHKTKQTEKTIFAPLMLRGRSLNSL